MIVGYIKNNRGGKNYEIRISVKEYEEIFRNEFEFDMICRIFFEYYSSEPTTYSPSIIKDEELKKINSYLKAKDYLHLCTRKSETKSGEIIYGQYIYATKGKQIIPILYVDENKDFVWGENK
ncbi:hypothetical protein [[Clostridium] aminophilum]|uniref:hypothetical protein n=1 Tax=[Clostridium] aminophilum TaxID=1526 RepID=UPI0033292338